MGVKHPGLMLKYSTFKNLASVAATRDDLETAIEFYLEVKNETLERVFFHMFEVFPVQTVRKGGTVDEGSTELEGDRTGHSC